MWPQLILMVLSVLQDFPQLVAAFQNMQNTGSNTPTDADWQQLTDAINARYAADLRWDNLKQAHLNMQALRRN